MAAGRHAEAETLRTFYDEARKLSQAAVKSWPEKNTRSYYEAIFSLVDLLQERGEKAMEAINAGGLSDADATRIQAGAAQTGLRL